jgi:hypothetical protein
MYTDLSVRYLFQTPGVFYRVDVVLEKVFWIWRGVPSEQQPHKDGYVLTLLVGLIQGVGLPEHQQFDGLHTL